MPNNITQAHINKILEEATIETKTVFNKCTFVSVKLKNGFVITESSACVDPSNYNEELGKNICLEHIKDRLWELEGYRLQCEIYKRSKLLSCFEK